MKTGRGKKSLVEGEFHEIYNFHRLSKPQKGTKKRKKLCKKRILRLK